MSKVYKAYILTAIDYGETCDRKARCIGVFFDNNEAQKELYEDIDYYKSIHPTYFEGNLAVFDEDGNGCEWNLEEFYISIPSTTQP